MKFIFSSAVHELGVRGVYFNIKGMRNRSSDDPDVRAFVDTKIATLRLDAGESPEAQGFKALHKQVSSRPDKLTASPLGLLQFLEAYGDIPRINGIVDVYNAVSIKTVLAIGAHNLSNVQGDITLRMTDGSEGFWPLGAAKPAKVAKGEYAYIDDANDILCRLEVRQVEKTKITMNSSDVFYIVQGHTGFSEAAIRAGAEELVDVSRRFFGGELEELYP